jgi:hypothetical protein
VAEINVVRQACAGPAAEATSTIEFEQNLRQALGLDPEKAGWVVLGINILAHRFRPAKTEISASEAGGGNGGGRRG